MSVNLDLATVWAFIIAFAVLMYVVMDGFDLGIGILFPAFRPGEERDQAMNAIAPVWDGNETWLVLGGVALLAAFPVAFAVMMPALYFPILLMLVGLIFRGVAFEFRERHATIRRAEADGRALAQELERVEQGRQRRRDAVDDRLGPLLVLLDDLPVGEDVIRALDLDLAEHVGVAPHQLVVDTPGHVGEGERPGLGGEDRVEHDLEEHVAEFVLDPRVRLEVGLPRRRIHRERLERLDRLVGLLQQVPHERAVGLLGVPREIGRAHV